MRSTQLAPLLGSRFFSTAPADRQFQSAGPCFCLARHLGRIGAQKRPRRGRRAEAARVELPAGVARGTSRTSRSPCTQRSVRQPFCRDPFWCVAGVHSQPAYYGRPQPASRTAQPWSSSVRAWVVAIWSCTICGDPGSGIKPPLGLSACPLLSA